ncbi:MAG: tetratricopeptide repeat protein [Pseudomonadota bacterium]
MSQTANELQQAIALHRQGQWEQAAALYGDILKREPKHVDALRLSGTLALQAEQPTTALELLTLAATESPGDARIHFHLGLAAQQLASLDLAKQCYELALTLKPDYQVALENLAVVLRDLGELEQALEQSRRALLLNPDSELALANAGTLAFNLGLDEEAMDYFRRSIARYPCNADIRLKFSQLLLRHEQFAAAWQAYEWRFLAADYLAGNALPVLHRPHWTPELPAGHVCVLGEQGIGDELMFASCLADLTRIATTVTVTCSGKLVPLLERSFPTVNVRPREQPIDTAGIDYRVSFGSLLQHFRRDADSFGSGDGFLVVDRAQRARWRRWRTDLGASKLIGIAWAGGAEPAARQARSIPVDLLVAALADGGTLLVALQYDAANADIEQRLPPELLDRVIRPDALDLWDDIDGTAALVSVLDHVVTVDNTLAHLAGALGVPTTVVLPVAAEGRWLKDRPDSPWYRSVSLIRQDPAHPGAWERPLLQLQKAVNAPVDHYRADELPVETPVSVVSPAHRKQVLFVNDTANGYHWGCTLTCNGLLGLLPPDDWLVRSCSIASVDEPVTEAALLADPTLLTPSGLSAWLSRQPALRDAIQRADLLLVNGEGTLHGTGDQALTLLMVLAAATAVCERPFAIVNHSAYPPADDSRAAAIVRELFQKVYARAIDVAVREPNSQTALAALGISSRLTFDCLPLVVSPRTVSHGEQIVIAGTASVSPAVVAALSRFVDAAHSHGVGTTYLYGANGVPAVDDHRLATELVRQTDRRCQITFAPTESAWLDTIGSAAMLLSGRFHHTLAAACLQTPFLAATSNTQKMDGLLSELGLQGLAISWQAVGEPEGFERAEALVRQPDLGLIEPTRLDSLKTRARANLDVVKRRFAEQAS